MTNGLTVLPTVIKTCELLLWPQCTSVILKNDMLTSKTAIFKKKNQFAY